MTLAVLLLAAMVIPAQGQVPDRKAKDSTANSATKYITWNNLATSTTGFTLSGLKPVSGGGTISGYAILQVASDTIPTVATRAFHDYTFPGTGRRDTLFFTDLTTVQQFEWQAPDPMHIVAARLKIVTSGTQKLYLYAVRWQR